MNTRERVIRYEVRVLGGLDARWSAWFADLEVASDAAGETTLSGPLPDQAALHGVLARVRDLGLPLIAVRRLDPDPRRASEIDPQMDLEERRPLMTHDQILELGQRWADAERRSDADALDTLLADDFVLVGPLGFVRDKAQYLGSRRSGDLKHESLTWDDVRVRVYGETAVAVGSQTQKSTYQGRDASGRFRVTQIAARLGGRWAVVGLHYSPIAQPPETGRP